MSGEPPIGFVRLHDAADMVGHKTFSWWRPIRELYARSFGEECSGAAVIAAGFYPDIDRVITMIAEKCEVGEIAAAYRSVTGADDLICSVWRSPGWRSYFATGTIDLDLPLLDEKGHPNTNGYTIRCTREVFVKKDDLDRFIAPLPKSSARQPSTASPKQIRAIVTSYRQSLPADATPSIEGLEPYARATGLRGHRDELREEYHRQFPDRQIGRPRK